MREGIPRETPLANKLWQVSQLLHLSPFDPTLLNHNEAQLDFILLMYVRDNPKGPLRVTRTGESGPAAESEVAAAWADVLTGRHYEEYMADQMPPEAVLRRLRGEPPSNPPPTLPATLPKPRA